MKEFIMKNQKISNIFFSLGIFIIFLFIFFVPPFQKPDEVVHFWRATSINHHLNLNTSQTKVLKRLYDYPSINRIGSIAHNYSLKYPWKLAWQKDPSNELVEYTPALSLASFISYLPVSIGINLGSFSAYPAVSFYLGRLFNLLFFAICLYFSVKLLAKNKSLLFPYLLIPMLWFQVTSISHDVVPLGLGLVLFSYFVSLFTSNKIDNKKILIFILLSFLFLISKPGYYSLFLLPLLLIVKSWKHLNKNQKNFYLLSSLALLVFLLIVFWNTFSNVRTSKTGGYGAISQFDLLKSNPLYFFDVFKSTMRAGLPDFWLKSFWGIFGWLDYDLNFITYLCIALLSFYSIYKYIKSNRIENISWFSIIFLGMIIFGGIFLIISSFYFTWSPVGAKIIDGVQGRYFLVYFPFLIFWLKLLHDKIGAVKFKNLLLGLGMGFISYQILSTTYYRYYDYSMSFGNDSLIENKIEALSEIVEEELDNQRITLFIGDDKFSGLQFFMKEKEEEETKKKSAIYQFTVYDGECSDKSKLLFIDYENSEYLRKNRTIPLKRVINPKNDYICVAIDKLSREEGSKETLIIKNEDEYLLYPLLISR
ncbi:MAG: DUF2142 domain-containing protein [Candidatus Pacebacteria bacterium]|nr:DUF2142 domain-containing protein [Candidatus Paceibacterota bacterium]